MFDYDRRETIVKMNLFWKEDFMYIFGFILMEYLNIDFLRITWNEFFVKNINNI